MERGKPEKNPFEQGENQQQTQPTYGTYVWENFNKSVSESSYLETLPLTQDQHFFTLSFLMTQIS